MTRTLYIFVDESGNENRSEYYGVTGCWCVSKKNDFTEVFDPTVQQLCDIAEGAYHETKSISELKGAKMPSDVLQAVVTSIGQVAFDDTTVLHREVPWQITHPMRYSIATTNPGISASALTDLASHSLDAPTAMKLLLLISILDPLSHEELVSANKYDDVAVILDAEVWERPAKHAQSAFDEVTPHEDISFRTRDSQRTPGLQLADLAVYSWCRHLREGDCREAVTKIDNYRFAEK